MPAPLFASLNEMLRVRVEQAPDECAHLFLADGQAETERLTRAELEQQARRIAGWLQAAGARGAPVLLLYPPGLEFIAAFWGCVYAGAIAVPAYPPRLKTAWPRLAAIVADAQARLALSTAEIIAQVRARQADWPQLHSLEWCASADLAPELARAWRPEPESADDPILLQYTSGSTRAPRGVLVSQRNLLHNLEFIHHGFGILAQQGPGVFWLPTYHDMGLIGGVLEPLYAGGPSILMPPTAFVEQPGRWLAAMTRYGASISGAPNFAYDWCVERIPPEQRASFDLRAWDVAFCGAEPVRLATLERFAQAFAPSGFRQAAFYPCYGLAEATLLAAGGEKLRPLVSHTLSRAALRDNRVAAAGDEASQTFVSCGQAAADQQILIVDPHTAQVCPPDRVGEIWLAGPSVARGYWNQAEETQAVFGARLADGAGPFLRTGDLGFVRAGQLFIAGRLKDLLVIRGRNHHPPDLEQTAETSHPAIQPGRCAAFFIEADDQEKVVLVCELRRTAREASLADVAQAVRTAIAREHELEVEAVGLVRPGHLPLTTSGKAQRHICRAQFLDHSLALIGVDWRSPAARAPEPAVDPALAQLLETLARQQLAEFLRCAPEQIDFQRSIHSLGLGSLQATALRFQMEERLGLSVPLELFLADLTLEQLIHRLAARTQPDA